MNEFVQDKDRFYALYLGIFRSLLAAYPIPTSSEDTPADIPDVSEVRETMTDMMLPSSAVFADYYLSWPTYPIKMLLKISKLYGFVDVDDVFQAQLLL